MRKAGVALVLLVGALGADAQNLLPDPAFSSGVSGWTTLASSFQWLNSAGPDGIPGFGRLQVPGPGSGFAAACVPVTAGRTYSWGASFRPQGGAGAFLILDFYSNSTCQGVNNVGEFFGPLTGTVGVWQFAPSPDVVAPATAASVLFRIAGAVPGPPQGVLDVDNVYFGLQGTGPPGIHDVPALSGSQVLVLALALAIGGLFLIRSD